MMSSTVRPVKFPRDKPTKSTVENNKTDGTSSKMQPTPEQIRMARMINDVKDIDDSEIGHKIKQIMDVTGKSSDEVIVALHDSDNDMNRAINMLLEGDNDQGEWETLVKKKKSRPPTNTVGRSSENASESNTTNNKENRLRSERGRDRDQNRARGPPRLNRGRGRESDKNEKNLEDTRSFERNSERRGGRRMLNGPSRPGRGRGPRIRTFQNRGTRGASDFPQGIDTWPSNNANEDSNNYMNVGNWDTFPVAEDWDNEDYTGSLSETKVFTPSANTGGSGDENSLTVEEIALTNAVQPASVGQNLNHASSIISDSASSTQNSTYLDSYSQKLDGSSEAINSKTSTGVASNEVGQQTNFQSLSASSFDSNSLMSRPSFQATNFPSSGVNYATVSMNSSQNVISSQLSTSIAKIGGASTLGSQAPVSYGRPQHTIQQQASNSLPQRVKPLKPRTVSTKIPSMAVEMPDDAIAVLGVQFGGLEFGTEPSSIDLPANSENSLLTSSGNTSIISNHITGLSSNQSSSLSSSVIPMGVTTSLTKPVKHTTDNSISGVYQQSSTVGTSVDLNPASGLSQNTLSQSSVNQINSTDSLYSNQSDRNVAAAFTSQRTVQASPLEGLLSMSLSGNKTDGSALNSYGVQGSSVVPSSNNANSNHGNYSSAYANQKTSVNYSSSSSSNQSHPSSLANANTYSNNGTTSVSSTVSSLTSVSTPAVSGYGTVSNVVTSVSFPSAVQQSSVSNAAVYGASSQTSSQGSSFSAPSSTTYVNQPNVYASTATTYAHVPSVGAQSGYGSSSLHTSSKLSSLGSAVKDSSSLDPTSSQQPVYDNSHSTSVTNLSSSLTTATSSITSSLGLGVSSTSSSGGMSSSKSSMSSGKTSVTSLPPGVPTVLGHQYIMGQTSVPFYGLQQPMYSYEDIQVLQQRLPLAGYYDIAFQPQTTLTGRDAGLASVAYSGTDSKFSRGDSNSSPVPTTLSQQQSSQQHQQTFLSPTALHGYSYYYPSGMVASGFPQYGAPIFPVPTATNAHGATTNTQFQKPTAYSSHAYSSAYDSLSQSQDYSKTGYGTSSQAQNKSFATSSTSGAVTAGTASDLASSVYSKTHPQLGKQSFDKPGFHAGTPPPFNLASSQGGPMGASSTTYAAAPFIPMMHHQQHHSPMLHHQLHQDSQSNASQRGGPSLTHAKQSSATKQNYGTNYWTTN